MVEHKYDVEISILDYDGYTLSSLMSMVDLLPYGIGDYFKTVWDRRKVYGKITDITLLGPVGTIQTYYSILNEDGYRTGQYCGDYVCCGVPSETAYPLYMKQLKVITEEEFVKDRDKKDEPITY